MALSLLLPVVSILLFRKSGVSYRKLADGEREGVHKRRAH
jgi:hypothetical protein